MSSPAPERVIQTVRRAGECLLVTPRPPGVLRSIAGAALVVTTLLAWTVALSGDTALGGDAVESRPSTASSALLAREAGIVARLSALASDPALAALGDGVRGVSERKLAQRVLARLRGSDGAIIRNACLVRAGRKGRTSLDGRLGDPRGSACVGRSLRDAVVTGKPGVVGRDLSTGDGRSRLLLAMPMADDSGRVTGVLSVDVDVVRLLDEVLPVDGGTGAMIIDLGSSEVIAGRGIGMVLADPDGEMLASVVPLWTLSSGAGLGLMELTPTTVTGAGPSPLVPPETTGPSEVGMLVGVVLLIVMLGMISYALGRSTRIEGSRARIGTLYQEASQEPEHDGLTGLPTLAVFGRCLAQQMVEYLGDGVPFALAVLDIDDLRAVNDRGGQAAGDETLVRVAESPGADGAPGGNRLSDRR